MIYDWYRIVSLAEFEALNLVSQQLTLELEGIGQRDILVTKGNAVSILFEGVFLSVGFNDKNPFEFDGHAVYLGPDGFIWLGIENEG